MKTNSLAALIGMIFPRQLVDLKSTSLLSRYLRDPLIENASFIFTSSFAAMLSGFFFWIIIARMYTTNDVGFASALISASGMIVGFSSFGLDLALIKYLPNENNKTDLINSCLTITMLSSLLLSAAFLVGIDYWSPNLYFLRDSLPMSLAFVAATCIGSIINIMVAGVFISLRQAKYSFFINLANFSRLLLGPLLVSIGTMGVFLSYEFSSLLSIILGFLFIFRASNDFKPRLIIDTAIARRILSFSFHNYLAKTFETLPAFVFPLLITSVLGATDNAYFYIAWALSAIFIIIPGSISNSFLTESFYYPEKMDQNLAKSVKFILILLTLSVSCTILFGKYILSIFGAQYAEHCYMLLVLLSIASVPFSINWIFISINRVSNNMGLVIGIFGSIAVISITMGYVLMGNFKLVGIGFAWAAGNGLVSIYLLISHIWGRKRPQVTRKGNLSGLTSLQR